MLIDQGLVYVDPVRSILNAKCASLPSLSPWLTAVEARAMSTSPYNNDYIFLQTLAFVPFLRYICIHRRSCKVLVSIKHISIFEEESRSPQVL